MSDIVIPNDLIWPYTDADSSHHGRTLGTVVSYFLKTLQFIALGHYVLIMYSRNVVTMRVIIPQK